MWMPKQTLQMILFKYKLMLDTHTITFHYTGSSWIMTFRQSSLSSLHLGSYESPCHFKCPHLHETVFSIYPQIWGDLGFERKVRSRAIIVTRHFNLHCDISESRSSIFMSFMLDSMWVIRSPWFLPSEIRWAKTQGNVTIYT